MRYAIGFGWGLVLLASFTGWGTALDRVLSPRRPEHWGTRLVLGIALVVAIGGVLNLLQAVSGAALLVIVGLGLLGLAIGPGPSDEPGPAEARPGWLASFRRFPALNAILGAGLIVLYGGYVYSRFYHPLDDQQAYLVYPIRLVTEGTLGDDPFNDRRLESALGGLSFLQAFAACVLDVRYFRLIDPGLALFATFGALLAAAGRRRCAAEAAPALLALQLLVPPWFRSNNISATLLPVALIVVVSESFATPAGAADGRWRRALRGALLLSALATLKSTLVPAAGLLLAAGYAAVLLSEVRKAPAVLAEGLLAGLLTLALLAPWMASMYRSSGTPLYPLLGNGYHGSGYGTFQKPYDGQSARSMLRNLSWFLSDPHIAGSILLAMVAAAASWRDRAARPRLLGFLATSAALVAAMAVIAAVVPIANSSVRYSFALFYALIGTSVVLVIEAVKAGAVGPVTGVAASLLVGLIAGADAADNRVLYYDKLHNIAAGLCDRPLVPASEVASYHRAQGSVPGGEPILVRASKPFLLDFRRNRLHVVDWPGGASPPPGMPAFRGGEPLADYLEGQGLRYVLYSYADEANLSESKFGRHRGNPASPTWIRTTSEHALDFQDSLMALSRSRALVYKDERVLVIDLKGRSISGHQVAGGSSR